MSSGTKRSIQPNTETNIIKRIVSILHAVRKKQQKMPPRQKAVYRAYGVARDFAGVERG